MTCLGIEDSKFVCQFLWLPQEAVVQTSLFTTTVAITTIMTAAATTPIAKIFHSQTQVFNHSVPCSVDSQGFLSCFHQHPLIIRNFLLLDPVTTLILTLVDTSILSSLQFSTFVDSFWSFISQLLLSASFIFKLLFVLSYCKWRKKQKQRGFIS